RDDGRRRAGTGRAALWQACRLLPRGPGLPRRRAPCALSLHHPLAGAPLCALVRDRDRLMAVFVALIRAVGPATHAKMRMAALRDACIAAGLRDVMTIGNTGNVLLRSDETQAGVRALVQRVVAGFGLDNEVFVTTPRRMEAVLAANPFPEAAARRPSEVGVCTLHRAPDWTPLTGSHRGPEVLAPVGS